MDPTVSADPALYDPTSYGTLTDQILADTGSAPPPGTPAPGSGSGQSLRSGRGGNFPGLPPPGAVGDLLSQIPGYGGITQLLGAVSAVVPEVVKAVQDALGYNFEPLLNSVLQHAEKAAGVGDPNSIATWNWITENTVGKLYTEMLELGLGVNVGDFDDGAKRGVQTVDHLLGFAALMPFVGAAAGELGKLGLANRWTDMIADVIGHLGEEMGLSWAMGLQIDEAFKVAVGRSIEEGINRQKRGNRIGWPQLRTMLKQHVFAGLTIDQYGQVQGAVPKTTTIEGEAVLRGLLENQGFPDQQIDMLLALSDQLLPVGDLQQLYLRGEMTLDEVTAYVTKLGFNDQDRDRLVNLYVSKAETEASTTLRTTARTMFENDLIGEQQYRDILTEAHFPQLEIDADIQAVKLVKQYGRTQATISTIKARLLHHQISPDEAVTELHRLNLANDYITELIQLWQAPPLPRAHGLTQAQVLRYYISGLLTRDNTHDRLIELGVNEADVAFLLDHPSASNGARQHTLTPALVTQAYIDGAIDQSQLPAMFKKVGVVDDAIQTYVQQALYRKAHHKGSSTYTAELSAAQIVAAFKYGVFGYQTAQLRLTELGYSGEDADIILEIENKGPFHGLDVMPFPTVDVALEYLRGSGFTLYPPPDPTLVAAEQVAATAGWTFTPPIPVPTPPA